MNKLIFSVLTFALIGSISAQTTFSNLEYVSTSRTTAPKAKTTTSEDGKHVVQKGETLSSIARLYGTSYQQILLLNNLTTETIKVGQVLIVPETAQNQGEVRGSTERKNTSSQGLLYAKKQLKHTVKAGDDIYSIADDYGVKIEDIRKLNNLPANTVNFKIGEEVVYSETYEPTNAEESASRGAAELPVVPVAEPTFEVEAETPPPAAVPTLSTPPKNTPKKETPATQVAEVTIVEPIEETIAGERMESGGFIGVEDKTQSNPYYIYHKTLKHGTKVRLHIPDNAGYVEAIVVNRLNPQRKEIIGLSPACYRLIGGKAATSATISYLP